LLHFDEPGGECNTLMVKPVRSDKRRRETQASGPPENSRSNRVGAAKTQPFPTRVTVMRPI